ncbi:MAG: Stage III sporulation protein AE [Syntrophomonadaceae bacterium]|nr:Stage III sporulation protein AE [Bacillota bacterium]
MYFKWAGAVLIVMATALWGNQQAAQMQRRVKQLEEFRLAMRLLMAEIGYTAAALTQAIVYLALIVIAMQSFTVAVELGRAAVDRMVELILAIIPLLLALLASLGNLASAAIFRPLMIFAVNFFATLTRDLVFPLIYFTTILLIINYFSPQVTVSRLTDLLKNVSVWTMGLSMTIFTGLLSIHGVASSVGDAVTIRSAKFMTGAFLPVVGGMLTDAVETVATTILKKYTYQGCFCFFILSSFLCLKSWH